MHPRKAELKKKFSELHADLAYLVHEVHAIPEGMVPDREALNAIVRFIAEARSMMEEARKDLHSLKFKDK